MPAYPYSHSYTDADGIQRQAQIHQTVSGREVVWSPRRATDPEPWQDLDREEVRYGDGWVDSD